MMDNHEFSVVLLRRFTEAMKKLTAEQADQLVNGTAELTFLPPGATVVIPGPDVHEVRKQLAHARNRQEATSYLVGLKLKKSALVSLAKQLDLAVTSRDTIPVLQRKIVEGTAGARADAAAIRDRAWSG